MPCCTCSATQTLELGASIIHAQNHYVLSLAEAMNLTAVKADDTDSTFSIYDGNRFVFKQVGIYPASWGCNSPSSLLTDELWCAVSALKHDGNVLEDPGSTAAQCWASHIVSLASYIV